MKGKYGSHKAESSLKLRSLNAVCITVITDVTIF